jgi:hypothetical protein
MRKLGQRAIARSRTVGSPYLHLGQGPSQNLSFSSFHPRRPIVSAAGLYNNHRTTQLSKHGWPEVVPYAAGVGSREHPSQRGSARLQGRQ